jgi:hypothetical protein
VSRRKRKALARKGGYSFHGRVNTHMIEHEVLARVHRDNKIITYFCHGLVSVFTILI